MKPKAASTSQAELLLHLYELRREAVMREARSYIGGAFAPRSAEDIVSLVKSGAREGSFVLQVYGYWDMVAAFVIHGVLPEPFVYDTCQEMYFQYAKLQPYLAGCREHLNLPEWMQGIEKVVEGSKAGRRRLRVMQESLRSVGDGQPAGTTAPPSRTRRGQPR